MRTSLSDGLAQTERALLGSVLLDNSLWPKAADLSVHDFSHDIHRKIYARMASMFEDQRPVDLITLTSELNSENPAYLSDLLTHALRRTSALTFVAFAKQQESANSTASKNN